MIREVLCAGQGNRSRRYDSAKNLLGNLGLSWGCIHSKSNCVLPGKGSKLRRPNRRPPNRLQKALKRVQEVYDDTPLSAVGVKLTEFLLGVQAAVAADSSKSVQTEAACNMVIGIIGSLPQTFEDRFLFDWAMIQALADQWSQGAVKLPNTVIPHSSGSEIWGHQRVIMPPEDKENIHFVDVILVPGEDDKESINLLSYPWLCHELGHLIFFQHGEGFTNAFKTELEKEVSRLSLKAIADRGAVREKAQKVIKEGRELWTPSPDHHNWAHELAIDVVALWACGPAYLAVFQDELSKPEIDPYQIDQNHPPYEVRASAMHITSKRLGWETYASGLTKVVSDNRKSKWRDKKGDRNRYTALVNSELINACISLALETCELLELPKCTSAHLDRVNDALRQGTTPDFGIELIWAAWVVEATQGEGAYDQWEKETLETLLRCITP